MSFIGLAVQDNQYILLPIVAAMAATSGRCIGKIFSSAGAAPIAKLASAAQRRRHQDGHRTSASLDVRYPPRLLP